ncbi:PREDICTED: uncharacterized protein LOC104768235 [Camelina sativa]|uniref:Uncharacterized protein LOC104768235 n=1 Tax=Camelina sativa TaxID=90675 RepID=A0ABM0XSN7_CAMSA|nr:PREDICTED: uncharacterized protein LOC104768235 [Camelina sativa]
MSSPDLDDEYDEFFDEHFGNLFQDCLDDYGNDQQPTTSRRPRAYIDRQHEEGHIQLWNDYFSENATFSTSSFRRRFRMNKSLFIRIVEALSNEVPYFQQRRDATGRLAWKGQYSRGSGKPTIVLEAVASQDLWIWHAFFGPPGTLNDINVLDRSPVFDDILEGRAPRVDYFVIGRHYNMAYYLTDGIYPRWATFIQSISLPQDSKASLFARCQEAA